MNELTELQAKFFLSVPGVAIEDDEMRIDASFLGEDTIITPSVDASPIANVIAALGNNVIPARDVAFLMFVLAASDIDLAAVIHQTLRKYAQSVNEPFPSLPNLAAEFAQEFAGYIPTP